MDDELFIFAPEVAAKNGDAESSRAWHVLSVEDDANYQASLVNILEGYVVKQQPIHMHTAGSAAHAAEVIAATPELSVVLLDVVMEDDDAGLRLVDTIRHVIGNSTLRVILLTGQAGMAPFTDVMQRYDIDEYWQKTDLTADKIRSVVAAHIRTWSAYHELEQARKGLTMVVEASRELSRLSDIKEYANLLLAKVSRIIDASIGGIICAQHAAAVHPSEYNVVSHSGIFSELCQTSVQTLGQLPAPYCERLKPLIARCHQLKQHQFDGNFSVLYFTADKVDDASNFMMVVESQTPLSDYHINLLKVFSENVSNGFNNILLCNRLSELAYYDAELHIPNRAWMQRFINNLSQDERQNALVLAITIRDYYDLVLSIPTASFAEVLSQFYQAIGKAMPTERYIARVNDDCFAVVLHKTDLLQPHALAELDHVEISADRMQLHIEVNTVLMDLALLKGEDADSIIHLLSSTVQHGRKSHHHYTEYTNEFRADILARHKLLQGLNCAIDEQQLVLVLQPKVRLSDESVVGFEALLRWKLPSGEVVSPGAFIPIAEMSGLINKVDNHVFHLTLAALEQLEQQQIHLPVSFNVTVSDLENDSFVDEILQFALSASPLAKLLEIEITESQAMEDYQRIKPILKQLMSCGVGVSIDDFGTGYSSLKHIAELGATHLKIDQTFVAAMMQNEAGNDVVDIIIRLGHRFNFTVVAEGVETMAQRERLQQLGCQVGQGYLFAKPMELPQLLQWLTDKSLISLKS
ncbi:EAL domain-containing protein [Shewanella sp. A3A]|nr:EAL domain-containing protein [Shewanella ferrihydritica]